MTTIIEIRMYNFPPYERGKEFSNYTHESADTRMRLLTTGLLIRHSRG